MLQNIYLHGINRNPKTGIPYGIIHGSKLNPDFLMEVMQHGKDLSYKHFCRIYKDEIRKDENFIEQNYNCENVMYEYKTKEFFVRYNTESNDVWIFHSKYKIMGNICSPCCPCACDIATAGTYQGYALPLDCYENQEEWQERLYRRAK